MWFLVYITVCMDNSVAATVCCVLSSSPWSRLCRIPAIECQFSNPDVLQSPLGPSVFRRDKTTTAVLTCPSLYSSIAPSSGQSPPYTDFCCHHRSRLSISLSLSMRPIPISLLSGRSQAPLSTRGTASRIRQELSPPQTILSNIATDL